MAEEGKDKRLTTRELLARAHPTVDGPTYRRLSGQIDEAEYQQLLNEERLRHGLPAIRPAGHLEAIGPLARLRRRLRKEGQ